MSIDEDALHGTLRLNGISTPIIVVGPGTTLYRGSSRADGHWEPAPAELRGQRCDPPPGFEHEFGVLYLGECETTVEFELQRLASRKGDAGEEVTRSFQPGRRATIAAHTVKVPVAFVDVDSLHLSTGYPSVGGGKDEVARWRLLSQQVYRNVDAHTGPLVVPVAGLAFRSRMRGCNGRSFALFADFRDDVLVRGMPRAFAADGPE